MNIRILPELIAAQATRTPDAVAVEDANGVPLRYAALERRAEALARRLCALGAGPGRRVGVCLRRGPDLVATLLAVWKTGAAYVPLDPGHPAARLAVVLADTAADVLVAEKGTCEALPGGLTARVLRADEDGTPELAGEEPVSAPPVALTGESPAYVLHTSGSTGRPKGVVVPHRGIAHRVSWLATRHHLGPGDRVLQKTTVGFDAAGLELFAPLVAGATVVLAPEDAERDPALLLESVARQRITVLQGVPSVLRALAALPGWEGCGALRLLFSAGEPLHAELCHQLLARVPQVEIWNTYGPTECSVDVTEHRFDPAQRHGPVPIGRPLGEMRALVLDPSGLPVAPGAEGELYAAGPGVALGYLGRPELTAERFVPDPAGAPGALAYRTGDLVRRRADGVLEYRGRLDQQLKVGGVRVEPGEVEAALLAHPRVDAAVAGAVPAGDGQRLVAWIQVRGTAPAPAELRAFLARTLPRPFVPAVFVPLSSFPRTPSGKTDTAALPLPVVTDGGSAAGTPPRTPAERGVAEAWAALLGLPVAAVGVHDDFFALGGSSLHLLALAAGLRDAGAHLTVRDLYTVATVAAQAALLPAGEATPPAGPARPVVPVPRPADGMPMAASQRGLWLMEQQQPGSAEWVSPQWVDVPSAWTEATVRAALAALADRHEALRTRYALRGDDPVQLVDPPGRPVELRTADAPDDAALAALTADELSRGFDLEAGPVWRALLVRSGEARLLLLTLHHIASDGWSSVLIERDLLALGAAAHTGTPAALPAVPVQFADHAAWQRNRPEADVEADLAHWRTVLDGIVPLELPADRPRPAVRDGHGGLVDAVVPAHLTEAVAGLGRAAGATLHQTLLTAFSVLLSRLTGRTDLTIGVPVAGRHRPETAQTVGFFLNTLVLRARTQPEATVGETLESVRDAVLDALAHQELPLERLVQELEPGRNPSRTPLYQVVFDLHEEGRTATAVPEAGRAALRDAWRSARTDLSLVVQHRADGTLHVDAHYATALFDAATVERLLARWTRVLEGFVAEPGAAVADIDLLPDDERSRLLALAAPDGPADTTPDGCVWTAFAERARERGNAAALVCGEETWSYARLLDRAEEFARRLRRAGAGPERTVAVLLPRSPELVAALLGSWAAGAAFVPLDAESPDDRLAHILADARVTALLTDAAGAARLAPRHPGPTLVLGEVDGTDPGDGSLAPDSGPAAADRDPARLAYVLYTSGTTGRPKGVAVEHRAVLRSLRAGQAHLGFGEGGDDAWLATAPYTFDIALTELVMPLLAGGRVILVPDGETTDAAALLGLMDRHEVSHFQCGAPQWRMLLDAGLGSRPLVGQTGGEPCPPALARELAGLLKRFVNEYGLTETAIAATRWEADSTSTAVPIGRPYPHATTHVLDERLRPVPAGTVGELCVGGLGLFRGYAGRPAASAACLVPNPYGPPGSLLLRTGDLVRAAADGTLHFAGRRDGQAKIRGRRVETAEVQAVLAEHPAVGEAVVVVHGTGDDARLAAYCVPAAGTDLPYLGELLDHCARSLPGHMLPTYVVPLERLPLTRHRKIDLAALPDPVGGPEADEASYTAPQGDVEETVARIWAEVLAGPGGAAPRIGARTGFFRIGGDSLRAARVIARIRDAYDIRLAPRTIFDRPTVAGLAEAVEEAVRAEIAALTDAELASARKEMHP
ncbi:amino acid adenylation domain-containing protein [Streptomyces albidoflavus]